MEKITAYRASDGALFDTEDQCERHEFSLKWQDQLNAFMASESNPYPNAPAQQRSMITKTVLGWEKFKVHNPGLVESK